MAARTPAPPNPLNSPAVVGLEASRKQSERRHRGKRRKQAVSSFVGYSVLAGVVVGVAYIGYTIYDEQQASDQVERDQRRAEILTERQQMDVGEVIDELEDGPRWNGPGAPAFGVGEDDAGIDAIVVTDP